MNPDQEAALQKVLKMAKQEDCRHLDGFSDQFGQKTCRNCDMEYNKALGNEARKHVKALMRGVTPYHE